MNIAVYPGSFDPPTNGHLSVIRRAAGLFDHVFVLIASNPQKRPLLDSTHRVEMLRSELKTMPCVTVAQCQGFVADFARKTGARYLIRGVRNETDLAEEIRMVDSNQTIDPGPQTVFFPPDRKNQSVSSTMLRMATKAGICLHRITSPGIATHLAISVPRHKKLQEHWYQLGMELDAKEKTWNRVFADLVRRYQSPHRKYHNLDHIKTCLQYLDRSDMPGRVRQELSLAFWFHDAVYHPLRRDNERRSAALAARRLRNAGFERPLIQRVKQLILMTRNHKVPPGEPWAELFADIDLAILSESSDRFAEYQTQIADEFGMLPKFKFQRGRRKVLNRLLSRDRIYLSPQFAHREGQARENLRKGLAGLVRE